MAIWLVLMLAAYLLGSIPVSYLLARLYRGIDLRQYGTRQVGGGNLWRMTSWRLGLPVGAFDFIKGLVMVWVADLLGLAVEQVWMKAKTGEGVGPVGREEAIDARCVALLEATDSDVETD